MNEVMTTSGWVTSASPASWPSPAMTLMTPGGNPVAVAASARMREVPGVISEVLRTIVLPAATAGRIFHAAICGG